MCSVKLTYTKWNYSMDNNIDCIMCYVITHPCPRHVSKRGLDITTWCLTGWSIISSKDAHNKHLIPHPWSKFMGYWDDWSYIINSHLIHGKAVTMTTCSFSFVRERERERERPLLRWSFYKWRQSLYHYIQVNNASHLHWATIINNAEQCVCNME